MDLFKSFDTYNLKARVFPAIIAGLPTLTLLFIIIPWDHLGISQAIATAMSLILVYAFSDWARHLGKNIQQNLGSGETPEQWHRSNTDVPEAYKKGFRKFIAEHLEQKAPSAAEEQKNPNKANDFYRAANAWLRERTRDTAKFSMLFNENVTYGFRRNLLGLKPVAVISNFLVLIFCISTLYFRPAYFDTLPRLDEKLTIAITAVVFHTTYMIIAVNKKSVWDASRAYGRQLILSCGALTDSKDRAKGQEKNPIK